MIPITHLLTVRDINSIKMIIAVTGKRITDVIDEAKKDLPELKIAVYVNGYTKGWVDYYKGIEKFSDIFERPSGSEATRVSK